MRSVILLIHLVILSVLPESLFAQYDLYKPEQKTKIQEFAEDFSRQQSLRYKRSQTLAKQNGIKIIDQIGDKKIVLQQINEIGEALYLGIESNQRSAKITRTDQLYTGGSLGLSINGNLAAMDGKLAIWDGGNVFATHQEFGGRVNNQESGTATDLHATHVAGTMIASGQIASARGMAFTPNSNRLNETFQPEGIYIASYTLKIFNIWGQELFSETGCSPKWDGNYMGSESPQGVYAYLIVAKGVDGKR